MNVTTEWLRVRRRWVNKHPPNHEGAYLCGICQRPVHYTDMELHHVYGRKGTLLSEEEHLVPTHRSCNQEVGSKRGIRKVSITEYGLREQFDL